MITEGNRTKLALDELRGKSGAGGLGEKEGFDSLVEVRAEFIREKCREEGVVLIEEKRTEPITFITLRNDRGDMASVSAYSAVFEPFLYCPEWGSYMKKWVRDEGFPEETIKSENLIRAISLEEAVEFLCT
jgi:hypothetical protein